MGTSIPGRRGAEYGAKLAGYLERALLLGLPGSAVVAIAAAVLVVGRPSPVVGVRASGGPTEGASALSFRVEVGERGERGERPMARRSVTVDVGVGGRRVHRFTGALDDAGAAQIAVALPEALGPAGATIVVSLDGAGGPIADEVVRVARAAWAGPATRRGGWVTREGRAGEGDLTLRAAAARGVFAVPFPDPLAVEVLRHGRAVASATVRIHAEGADVGAASAVTNERGEARISITPREHSVSLVVEARAPDGAVGRLELSPGVVPGALHAEVQGAELVVRAPISRDRAYVAVVHEGERLLGATVPLRDDGRGGSVGTLALPPGLAAPVWAVVSSEPDLRSPARVGWPVLDPEDAPPRSTFDVADVPWFDTFADALAREERRVRRLRVVLGGVAVVALALTALLVVRRARAAEAELAAHLEANLESPGAGAGGDQRSRFVLLAAVVSLLFAALLAFAFVLSR